MNEPLKSHYDNVIGFLIDINVQNIGWMAHSINLCFKWWFYGNYNVS